MQESAMGEKEVKRQEIQKKVFYTEQTANQLITYYYYLGQIHQALDDHEKATLNFSKALSIPNAAAQGMNEASSHQVGSYCKLLLSRQLITLYKADDIVFNQPRTLLHQGSLLHFTSQPLLEQVRQQALHYHDLQQAIDSDSQMKMRSTEAFGGGPGSETGSRGGNQEMMEQH